MIVDYVFNESAFKHDIAETDIRRTEGSLAFARPLFDGLIDQD